MDVFLCGALAEPGLAAAVLGCDPAGFEAARLQGFAATGGPQALGGLIAGQGGVQGGGQGVIVRGLDAEAQDRLRYYLAVHGLALDRTTHNNTALMIPVPAPQGGAGGSDRLTPEARAQAAVEVLAHRHSYTPAEMAQRLTPIHMRAAQWAQAQAQPPAPDHDPDRDVIVHAEHRPYMNFFAMREMDLQFRQQDGTMSDVVNRGALVMGAAAVVLPYDPARDAVLLVEQFRAPLFIGGCRSPWTWEPVAGLVDPGETPEQTAHREAMEEAGLSLRDLVPVGPAYSSTGSLSDHLSMFVGICDLSQPPKARGLASEGEDIRSQVLGFDTLLDGIDAQLYPDLPLIAIALWLARHRDRVRDRLRGMA